MYSIQVPLWVLLSFLLYNPLNYCQEYTCNSESECFSASSTAKDHLRVAIVGSGAGGSAAAFFLKKALGERVKVDIFEKDTEIGGRIKSILLDGINVELGGSVYHQENFFIRNFTLHNNFTESCIKDEAHLGVWNGKQFVFLETSSTLMDLAGMIWNYGLSPFTTRSYANEVKDKFLNIYPLLLQEERGFRTVQEIFKELGLYNLTEETIREALKKSDVCDAFIDEIVIAITKINYGQNVSMNALSGFISLVGSGSSVFSVEEGLVSVLKKILQLSEANLHLRTKVNSVISKRSGNDHERMTYIVDTKNSQTETSIQEEFDIVIVAAPLEFADIQFSDDIFKVSELRKREYQTTHVTVVIGEINNSYFNINTTLPSTIGTTDNVSIPFRSISLKGVGKSNKKIYKLFSDDVMEDGMLRKLFSKFEFAYRHAWKAYPKLHPSLLYYPPITFGAHQVYYLNAMEMPFSVIEVEMIAAKNIVNLIKSNL